MSNFIFHKYTYFSRRGTIETYKKKVPEVIQNGNSIIMLKWSDCRFIGKPTYYFIIFQLKSNTYNFLF